MFPVDVFIGYGSEIHVVEAQKRQRKPRSAKYRDAWEFILQWALGNETGLELPVLVEETAGNLNAL